MRPASTSRAAAPTRLEPRGSSTCSSRTPAAARQALSAAGYEVVQDRPVVAHELEDVPGSAGAALRRIADAGANLELVYLATATRLVVGSDDVDAARSALEG